MLSATADSDSPLRTKKALISLVDIAYPRGVTNRDGRDGNVRRVSCQAESYIGRHSAGMAIDSSGFWDRLQEVFSGANAPEIARLTGRTKQTVYRWRDGQLPDLDILADIAESRGVSLHWLVTGKGPKDVNGDRGAQTPKPQVATIEPGQVPVYFGPYEQEKIRDMAKAESRTFEEQVRDIVLQEMERRGMINVPEESNVVFFGEPVRSVTVPLMGWIAAGEPIHVVAERQDVNVPDFFMKRGKDYFVLHVRGDSMIDDQIIDGSLIVCEARQTATDGEKVVAMIDGDKATVKRIYHEGDRIRLQPANPLHKPIYVEPDQRLDIQGVVVGIFHKPS